MKKLCINCEHCDHEITNSLGQVRCKKFSTFVNSYSDCDYFSNAAYDDHISHLYDELERENNGL